MIGAVVKPGQNSAHFALKQKIGTCILKGRKKNGFEGIITRS